ncbi:MAG: hypothetical protein K6G88_13290 [Lachnospiraceae bacterium]|nr:hypothetical protein [Lachnospiraceae bacterium]
MIIKNEELEKTEEKEILGELVDSSTPTIQGDEELIGKYKEIEVHPANTTFRESSYKIAFAVGFTVLFLMVIWTMIFFTESIVDLVECFLFCAFFGAIAFAYCYIVIKELILKTKARYAGKEVKGMIIECDNEIGNYSILVRTSKGYRYFRYHFDENVIVFKIKEIVELKVWNDTVYIKDNSGVKERIEDEIITNQYVLCKSVPITFYNTFFNLYIGLCAVFAPLLLGIELYLEREYVTFMMVWFPCVCIVVFIVVGIYLLVKAGYYVFYCILTVVRGRKVTGIVLGYIRKGISYNGLEGVFYTIQINTSQGQRLIQYEMHGPSAPYNKYDLVELKVYGDYYKIIGKE